MWARANRLLAVGVVGLLPLTAWANVASVTDGDSTPDCYGWRLIFDSATAVTDNNDGTCTVALASGGAGDITAVGNCASGAAFGGACGTTLTPSSSPLIISGDLRLSSAGATLEQVPTSGDTFEQTTNGSMWFLSNKTDGVIYLSVGAAHQVNLGSASVSVINLVTSGTVAAANGFTGALTGNAATATALAANGANCSAGNYPLGVDASGNVESCTAAGGGSPGGSGTELQYRGGASTFSAVTNSSVSGADVTLAGNLTVGGTTPALAWSPMSGNKFELWNTDSMWGLSNTTTGAQILKVESNDSLTILKNTAFGGTVTGLPYRGFWYPASSLLPLEAAADSIPPVSKDAGTNVDQLTVSFDATTDECRTVNFLVPTYMAQASTVTFTLPWYSLSATTGRVNWDIRTTAGAAAGVDPDTALTTFTADSAVAGTTGQTTYTTISATPTQLGWVANDLVILEVCRNADGLQDTMTGDAELVGMLVQ